jgi:hypothetical protein
MPTTVTPGQQFIQEAYILVTGGIADAAQIATYQSFIQGSNYSRLDTLIDDYMNALTPAAGGVQKLLQTIAKNGLGMTISDQDAPAIVQYLMNSVRITSWSQLLHWLSDYQGDFGDALTNKGTAANNFLTLLDTSGKSAFFKGAGPTVAATNLLQSIGSSAASLVKANSDFAALSSNLTATGIKSLVVDGYIKDATVFIDTNGDGQLSAGEWSTKTDASGGYVLPADAQAGGIVAFGGTDLLTGKSFQGVLTAPAGSTVVNPLTTMVQAVLADSKGGLSVAEATASVSKALSLPADVSILSYDPLAVLASTTSTAAAKATALATQTVALQVSNIITQVGSTIDAGSTKVNNLSAASAVTSALAGAISTASSTVSGKVDLNSATTIQALVQTAAISAGATTVAAQASQLASVTSASNTSASSAKTIDELAKSAVVSQGAATDSLVAGATSGSLASAVSSYTGSALTTAVSAAKAVEIAPGVPTTPTPVTPVTPVTPPTGGGGGGGGVTPVFAVSENAGLINLSANFTGVVVIRVSDGDVATFTKGDVLASSTVSNFSTKTINVVDTNATFQLTGGSRDDVFKFLISNDSTGMTVSGDLSAGVDEVCLLFADAPTNSRSFSFSSTKAGMLNAENIRFAVSDNADKVGLTNTSIVQGFSSLIIQGGSLDYSDLSTLNAPFQHVVLVGLAG